MDESPLSEYCRTGGKHQRQSFQRPVQPEYGQTFIEYLTTLRMEHARELLRCTGKRSSEIAAEVGYKDAHYFSYLFKKTQE